MSFSIQLGIVEIFRCEIGISWDIDTFERDDWLGAVISDQLSDVSRIIPFIGHNVRDGLPRPRVADLLKAPAVLPLGRKQLTIND
jgi:hypothetical protein